MLIVCPKCSGFCFYWGGFFLMLLKWQMIHERNLAIFGYKINENKKKV
jgi:hypothetical protein